MTADTFTVTVEATWELTADEIFPDGVPDGASVDDVVDQIRQSRSATHWLRDWNLESDVIVSVERDGDGDVVLW